MKKMRTFHMTYHVKLEDYPDGLLWYVDVHATSIEEAVNALLKLEPTLVNIVSINER